MFIWPFQVTDSWVLSLKSSYSIQHAFIATATLYWGLWSICLPNSSVQYKTLFFFPPMASFTPEKYQSTQHKVKFTFINEESGCNIPDLLYEYTRKPESKNDLINQNKNTSCKSINKNNLQNDEIKQIYFPLDKLKYAKYAKINWISQLSSFLSDSIVCLGEKIITRISRYPSVGTVMTQIAVYKFRNSRFP